FERGNVTGAVENVPRVERECGQRQQGQAGDDQGQGRPHGRYSAGTCIHAAPRLNCVTGWLPVDLAIAPWVRELQALLRVLEDFQFHAAGVGQPALPGVIDTELLVGDGDALSARIGDKTVDIVGFKADVVNLIRLGESRLAL